MGFFIPCNVSDTHCIESSCESGRYASRMPTIARSVILDLERKLSHPAQ